MSSCSCCNQEAEKTAKITFSTLDGEEIRITVCGTCATRIDEHLACLVVCRNCRAVLLMENNGEENLPIQVQDECPQCSEQGKGAQIFPMI